MLAMAAIIVMFAEALLIESALCQVCGRSALASALSSLDSIYGLAGSSLSSSYGYNALANDWFGSCLACHGLPYKTPAIEVIPTTGGGLCVTSISAPEISLEVSSENVYEGTLAVGGELPFIGTVGLEGVMPSAGLGTVDYACGDGATRMLRQDGATVSSGFENVLGPADVLTPGNLYGGIGVFGDAEARFGCDTGLAGLAYHNLGLVGAYPTNGFAGGAFGSTYGGALTPAAAYGGAMAPGVAYGGEGEGKVAVFGELPVAGNTALAGQVPIRGAVRFNGMVPAAGKVVITGKCGCGCRKPYVY